MEQLLQQVELPLELAERYPHQVSGGQCQRAAIARALAIAPDILICDEATSALDVTVQAQIVDLLKQLQTEMNLSILLISHDLDYVAQYADQVILIDGTVKKQGTVRQVYESEEFRQVFGRFDLENYKPSRQVKEQQKKEITMPKHSHGLWKEEE